MPEPSSRQSDFAQKLALGNQYERLVSDWLMTKGWRLLAAYEYSGEDKAPRLMALDGDSLIVPDLLAAKDGKALWFEVKFKTSSDFTRITKRQETGISARLADHYSRVETISGIPVWLIFCHLKQDEIIAARLADVLPLSRSSSSQIMGRMKFFPVSEFKRLAALSEIAHAAH